MTAKLPVRGMTFQLQSVGGGRQALAIPLTETQGQTSVLPSQLVSGTDLKVVLPCCLSKKPYSWNTTLSSSCTCIKSVYTCKCATLGNRTKCRKQVAVSLCLTTAEIVTALLRLKVFLCLR